MTPTKDSWIYNEVRRIGRTQFSDDYWPALDHAIQTCNLDHSMFLNDPNKNKALAGFVLVCPPHSEAAYQYKLPTYLPNTDTLYEIAFVAVDPAHEGKGFGKQMMRSLAQSLFERLRSAWLHVDDTNIRARKLYESLGFRSQYDIHDPYGSFGQVMVLRPPVQYSAISGNDAVVQTKGGIPTSM